MKRALGLVMLGLFVGACTADPFAPRPAAQGVTASGETTYVFTLTRSNALGVTPVSNKAIAARAGGLCPAGYREVSRFGSAERRISGVIYTDVTVRIVCS